METTRLAYRDVPTEAALGARLLLELSAPQPAPTAHATDGAELVLVVGVVPRAPGAQLRAAKALYCAALPPGTALEREQLVSAVSGLVRRFEAAPERSPASGLPLPKWG